MYNAVCPQTFSVLFEAQISVAVVGIAHRQMKSKWQQAVENQAGGLILITSQKNMKSMINEVYNYEKKQNSDTDYHFINCNKSGWFRTGYFHVGKPRLI